MLIISNSSSNGGTYSFRVITVCVSLEENDLLVLLERLEILLLLAANVKVKDVKKYNKLTYLLRVIALYSRASI